MFDVPAVSGEALEDMEDSVPSRLKQSWRADEVLAPRRADSCSCMWVVVETMVIFWVP